MSWVEVSVRLLTVHRERVLDTGQIGSERGVVHVVVAVAEVSQIDRLIVGLPLEDAVDGSGPEPTVIIHANLLVRARVDPANLLGDFKHGIEIGFAAHFGQTFVQNIGILVNPISVANLPS